MIDGAWRLWRGLFVGLAVVVIAVLGHVLAGGTADIHTLKFAVLGLMTLPVAVCLSDREWTTWRLLATLGAAQVLIHVVLQVRPFAPAAMPSMAGMHPMSGMKMHAVGPFSPQSTMFFSHVVAVAITALVLRRGEELVLGIRTRLACALTTRFHDVRLPALRPLVVRVLARPTTLVPMPVLAGAVTRRGPPVVAAVRRYACATAV
jgi:hypothetical protein